MPPGGSSPSPAQPDRGAPSLEVAVAAVPPPTWGFGCFSIYSKNSPPSFILSGRPFFEVIAQGCNWIAVISATGNTKCCNLSINRGGPHQADRYAGVRGGGARVWPTCGRVGRVGPGRARGGAQAGRRAGGAQAGRGVCAFAVANAIRCILTSPCIYIYTFIKM